jgi:hypothetical protein
VRTIELDGDYLLVPHFSYLSGELLSAVDSAKAELYEDG